MRRIGFSTGALAFSDFKRALTMLKATTTTVVELSALRLHEVDPLLQALDSLDLSQFSSFISVHAPSGVDEASEPDVVAKLAVVAQKGWSIVVHPDAIHDTSLWRPFGRRLCIENMDKRKPIARTAQELAWWFEQLPEASLCLDLAHARQIDPSMTEAYVILRDFGSRLAEIHLSELDFDCRHERISLAASLAYREVAAMIPEDVPIILESVIPELDIEAEILAAHAALPSRQPRVAALERVASRPVSLVHSHA
jgi:hypothetical protein